MERKKHIRSEFLKLRKSLSDFEWENGSDIIADAVINSEPFLQSDCILCYVAYNKEVDTTKIMETAFSKGKAVYVPKVEGPRAMSFYRISSLDDLKPGAYGILEPEGNTEIFAGQHGDTLMIVPGVAFDVSMNRMGYGGGYYDTFLEKYPYLNTMAIAFSLQIAEELPVESTDKKMNFIITEKGRYENGLT